MSICSSFQSGKIVLRSNYLHPMAARKCKLDGNAKTDLLHGESFAMASGEISSSEKGRAVAILCNRHLGEYVERRSAFGRLKEDFYARGVLVKIGGIVAIYRNEHIGIRLRGENKPQQSATPPEFDGKKTWGGSIRWADRNCRRRGRYEPCDRRSSDGRWRRECFRLSYGE